MLGLDYSAGRISGAAIRGAGYGFVVRYAGTPGRTKNIIRSEFQDLVANGVTCWLVYENSTDDVLGGFAGGVNAARAARADADSIGYPAGGVIFFCADRHLTAGEVASGLSYLDGAASVLGRGAVGAYGFSEFINAAKAQGKAAYYWQCGSQSTVGAGTNIYQRNTGYVYVGGIQCDVNDLFIPIGGAVLPGGIESMAFNDTFTDSYGNTQSVLSWMNHQDERSALLASVSLNTPDTNGDGQRGDISLSDFRQWQYDTARAQSAQLAALTAAVAALSTNNGLTPDAVKQIVTDAVKQNLHITGTLQIDGSTP